MEWRLGRHAPACQSCEAAFEPEADYYTVLTETNEEFDRLDLCPSCFARRAECPEDVFFWKGRRPAAKEAGERRVDFQAVKAFLKKSRTETSLAYLQLNYVLALILVRKKMLRIKEMSSRGRQDYLRVHFTKEDEVFEIPVPELRESDVTEVQNNLMDLFRQHAALDPGEADDAEADERAEAEARTEDSPDEPAESDSPEAAETAS